MSDASTDAAPSTDEPSEERAANLTTNAESRSKIPPGLNPVELVEKTPSTTKGSVADNPPLPALSPCWALLPETAALLLSRVIRHAVVSQIIRPEIAAFMPDVTPIRTRVDTKIAAVSLQYKRPGTFRNEVQYIEGLPHLRKLKLYGVKNGPALLEAIVPRAPLLTSLDLRRCRDVNARALAFVAQLTRLEELNLSCCTDVDDVGLAEVAKLPEVRTLDLIMCPWVDGAGLRHLAASTKLERLYVNGCGRVDAEALAHVRFVPCLSHNVRPAVASSDDEVGDRQV